MPPRGSCVTAWVWLKSPPLPSLLNKTACWQQQSSKLLAARHLSPFSHFRSQPLFPTVFPAQMAAADDNVGVCVCVSASSSTARLYTQHPPSRDEEGQTHVQSTNNMRTLRTGGETLVYLLSGLVSVVASQLAL